MSKTLSLATGIVLALTSPSWAADITGGTDLPLARGARAILYPDGQSVLYITQNEKTKTHAYWRIGADGKNAKKLYDSAVQFDDLFTLCFGKGTISPDGKHFVALTTDNGKNFREGGKTAVVLVDANRKTTALPSELGAIHSAVFVDNDTVYYIDSIPPRTGPMHCKLRRFQISTGKAETVLEIDDASVYGLTVAPDGKRIGGCTMQVTDNRRKQTLWAYDIAAKKADTSPALLLDDYVFDGASNACWSEDGTTLYTNGHEDKGKPVSKADFSILAWTPFAKDATKALAVLPESLQFMTASAFGPDRLSVCDKKSGGVLNTRTGKYWMLPRAWLLISRAGAVGLFTSYEADRYTVIALPTIEKQLIDPDVRS